MSKAGPALMIVVAAAFSGCGAPRPVRTADGPPPEPARLTAKETAKQHYLSGLVFFQRGDYRQAHREWVLASQLDPQDEDIRSDLERLEDTFPEFAPPAPR